MRVILFCALALAVGCGGGGTTMASAQLAGTVYEVDGQSSSLGGVPVVLKETGEWTWTDAAGSFEFDGLEGGTYTLDFMGDSDLGDSEGASGAGDEFADGDGDPKVDVPDGGRVECDVALEDGKVKDFSSDHEEGLYAMARLHMTDAAWLEGFRLEGAIKIAARGDGTLFKVCVEGLEGGDALDIYVGEQFLGTATSVEGRACLVLENELSVDALRELAGLRVDVYLHGTDLRLMVGEVPSLKEHEEDGDDKPDGSDDGDKPGEDDGDNCECEDGDKPDEGDGSDEPGGDDGDEPDDDDDSNDGDEPNDDGTDGEGEGDGEGGEEPGESGGDDEPGDGEEGSDGAK